MYYDIVESGKRIKGLRTARGITRLQLAEGVGISVDAMRKIESGTNGAKIDTLVSIADYFCVSLDFIVCGYEKKVELDSLLAGLDDREVQFVRNIVLNIIKNMPLINNK